MAKTSKTVRVTPAQKRAAKALIRRRAASGEYVSPSVTKIANASAGRSSTPLGNQQNALSPQT